MPRLLFLRVSVRIGDTSEKIARELGTVPRADHRCKLSAAQGLICRLCRKLPDTAFACEYARALESSAFVGSQRLGETARDARVL